MLKKWRIVVNRISKVRQTTCNWIKKILDESNKNSKYVFNILILLFVFIMFNKLTCKADFTLRYKAWVNAIRVSSFIENFPQINAKPIAFQWNLLGKLSRNRLFLTNRFSAKLASKIPTKFPQNRPFFPRICPWKSCKIWLFFPPTYQKPCIFNASLCYNKRKRRKRLISSSKNDSLQHYKVAETG